MLHSLKTFLFKTKLLIQIHLQLVNLWEGERDIATIIFYISSAEQNVFAALILP